MFQRNWLALFSACQFLSSVLCTPFKYGSSNVAFVEPDSVLGEGSISLVNPVITTDCGNKTHTWHSVNGSCFDVDYREYQDHSDQLKLKRNLFSRDLFCPEGRTSCWVINCCEPGEICGSLTEGCIISWSTIYSTITSTYSATLTRTVTPKAPASTTVQTITETAYVTSVFATTLPGSGPDTVYSTSSHSVYTTIADFYNVGPKVVTKTVTAAPSVTDAPKLQSRGVLQRREQRTSYTTITKTVVDYGTPQYVTVTFTGDILTRTLTLYKTQTAVQTQTHYETPNDFKLVTVDVTTTISDYAYGTMTEAGTITYTTTLQAVTSSTKLAAQPAFSDGTGASSDSSSSAYQGGISKGALAGIIVGSLIGLVLLGALLYFCYLLMRRRRRIKRIRKYEDTPTPPSPPMTQSPVTAMNVHNFYDGDYGPYPTPNSPRDSPRNSTPNSPLIAAPAAAVVAGAAGSKRHRRNHSRKGSRGSIVSVSPVPEEDEDIRPAVSNRHSSDSINWGRGYGGRGGFNSPIGRGGTRMSSGGRSNRQFSGQSMSSYVSESLVPPHSRK